MKSDPQTATTLQFKLAKKIIKKNILPQKIRKICAVDVSYKSEYAFCAAVVYDAFKGGITELVKIRQKVTSPYIPGLFMLREAKPILVALKRLESKFDVLLVDGHGRAHPRFCGIACYVGLKINKPTIGVAKRLLCGKIRSDGKVEFNGQIVGHVLKNQNHKIIVSIGHKISLRTASRIVSSLIKPSFWYPEPLRLADFNSKKFRTEKSH